jgi:hypothetical protein
MNIIKLKRNRLGAVLSTIDPNLSIPLDTQRTAVANWSTKAAKVLIYGPEAPVANHGVRHVKTASTAPINNLLATYMQSIPGNEVCMIANPDCVVADVMPLLSHIDAQRMEMAWAGHVDFGIKPSVFFLSSPVVAHLLNDIPQGMTFKNDWQFWIHNWFQKLLRHRYFDATPFAPVVEIAFIENVPTAQSPVEISVTQVEAPNPGVASLMSDLGAAVAEKTQAPVVTGLPQREELSSLTLPSKRNKGPLKKVKIK